MKFNSFVSKHKKLIVLLLCCLMVTSMVFADDTAAQKMEKRIGAIVNFFSNGWVKGVMVILLIGECLGLLVGGGQNPQIFKKFLPFIVGTLLFMSAGSIVTMIWGTNPTFAADAGLTTE